MTISSNLNKVYFRSSNNVSNVNEYSRQYWEKRRDEGRNKKRIVTSDMNGKKYSNIVIRRRQIDVCPTTIVEKTETEFELSQPL